MAPKWFGQLENQPSPWLIQLLPSVVWLPFLCHHETSSWFVNLLHCLPVAHIYWMQNKRKQEQCHTNIQDMQKLPKNRLARSLTTTLGAHHFIVSNNKMKWHLMLFHSNPTEFSKLGLLLMQVTLWSIWVKHDDLTLNNHKWDEKMDQNCLTRHYGLMQRLHGPKQWNLINPPSAMRVFFTTSTCLGELTTYSTFYFCWVPLQDFVEYQIEQCWIIF